MPVLVNLALVVGFAFLARAILHARGVSWIRLVVASVIGLFVGLLVSAAILLGPDSWLRAQDSPEYAEAELFAVALPFQLVTTMGAVVVFELVSSRPPRRRRRTRLRPIQAARRQAAIAGRGMEVMRVATRHGLGAAARRGEQADEAEQARRLRSSIEDLGGVYVKLGQLLATRPDLLPPEATEELGKLHASVTPLSTTQVRQVVADELGSPDEVFAQIDPEPLGSASIGQVHAARLPSGEPVVVKVQRPGLPQDVERDLAILDWVAATAEKRLPIAKSYGVAALTDDFAAALRTELDFRNEARDVAEIAAAVSAYPLLHVPAVMHEHTTPRVLVMEQLHGTPLANLDGDMPPNARQLADALCLSQVRAMIRGERFHGDPHPGNVLLLDDGRLGLIDFGMTGKLDAFGRAFVLEMLVAVRLGDAALLYEALVTGGAVDLGGNRDEVERALAAFLATHLGSGMISADALTELARVTADLGIALPDQASLMMRSVATLVGTLETLSPGYPLVDMVSQAAGVEMKAAAMPTSVAELAQKEAASFVPFLRRVPRHVDRVATQLERGQLTTRVNLFSSPSDVAVLERLLNKVLLTVLGLGIVGLSILLIRTEGGPELTEEGLYLTQLLGWVTVFFGAVLTLRALLDVLRADSARPR